MDLELIVGVGGIFYYNIIDLICFAVPYGTFLLSTIIAMLLLISPKEGDSRSRQRLLLILFTIILFIINTADFANTFGPLFVEATKALMTPLSGGIAQQSEVAGNALELWVEISNWLPTIELCISDVLVVWRAIAIWSGNAWVKWSLIIITLIDIGINLTEGITSDLPSSVLSHIDERKVNTASLYISLGTNLVATALIGLKFWLYRKSLRGLLGKHRATEIQNILLLLVESGAIFLAIQTAMAVMSNIDIEDIDGDQTDPFVLGYTAMEQIFEETCSLYPIAVIIMINSRSSLVDSTVHDEGTKVNDSSLVFSTIVSST